MSVYKGQSSGNGTSSSSSPVPPWMRSPEWMLLEETRYSSWTVQA